MKGLGLLKSGILLLSKHKTAILAGTAIVSAIGTVVLTVRATFKADERIVAAEDDKYERLNEDLEDSDFIPRDEVKLTPIEVVKATWKCYIPVAVGLAGTVTCIVCAHRIDAKRIAAATSALILSEKMNKELEHKTIEEFGKEKVEQIKEKIFHENGDLNRAYKTGEKPAFQKIMSGYTGNNAAKPGFSNPCYGEQPCWFKEEVTGRRIWATKSQIERAMTRATLEAGRNGHGIITVNSWLEYLDEDPSTIGEMLGWDVMNGQELDITYEPDIGGDGMPELIMHYHSQPRLI